MRTWTYLQALAFHPVENPSEEALHLQATLAGKRVSWGPCGASGASQTPRNPFLWEPGRRRAVGGNFLTAGPRPGRMQLHPWSRVEHGEREHFRVIFRGSHVRVVLIPAERGSGTS